MFLIWLCKARKDTGESMASRLLAQRRTTFSPVWWIFSVSWSTAMLLGAQTSTGLQRAEQGVSITQTSSAGPTARLHRTGRQSHAKAHAHSLPRAHSRHQLSGASPCFLGGRPVGCGTQKAPVL